MTREEIADDIAGFAADDESYLVTLEFARYVRRHLPTILAALRAEPSEQEVERARIAIAERDECPGLSPRVCTSDGDCGCRETARAALQAARSRP